MASAADDLRVKPSHKVIVRGATTHFSDTPSYVRNILDFCRAHNVEHLVVSTDMASQGLRTHFRRNRKTGKDATVDHDVAFQGDEDDFFAALTGRPRHTPYDRQRAIFVLARMLRRMHEAGGRVLVLCQVGRNRSFTTAFLYYLVYYGAGKSVQRNLKDFKAWEGVSYDAEVQRDGHQRLDHEQPSLPWMRALARIFEDKDTGKVTQQRIDLFMTVPPPKKPAKKAGGGGGRKSKSRSRSPRRE